MQNREESKFLTEEEILKVLLRRDVQECTNFEYIAQAIYEAQYLKLLLKEL